MDGRAGLAANQIGVSLRAFSWNIDGEIGYVYAGCGIVDGSRAADEYDEIALKLKTVLSAFDGEAGASSPAAQTSPQTTTAGEGEAR